MENIKSGVAIIILNYNSWQLTIDFIENEISKIELPERTQIVVVDNCSPNESIEQLKKWNVTHQKFILIENEKNTGYAAGNNVGLRWAEKNNYAFAWVTNTDILFDDPQTLRKMISVLKKDPSIGVVSPRVFTPSGMETNRNLFRPSVWDLTFGKIQYRKRGRTLPESLKGWDNTYCYNYRPQGCCMLLNLEAAKKVDYMDEHTFLYMEEPILAERLLNNGYKGACCLDVNVVHNHSTTVASVAKRKQIYKWQHDSEVYYYKKYRNFSKTSCLICTGFTAIYYYIIMRLKNFR